MAKEMITLPKIFAATHHAVLTVVLMAVVWWFNPSPTMWAFAGGAIAGFFFGREFRDAERRNGTGRASGAPHWFAPLWFDQWTRKSVYDFTIAGVICVAAVFGEMG